MKNNKGSHVKLGLFVVLGLTFFIFLIYFIGMRQNLFSSTTQLYAIFRNVDGLREGNTVRFAGIDVGMVRSIEIVSDTTVRVTVVVNNTARQFIKKDSKVTIGSEGLIGNRLVSISSGSASAPSVDGGDYLAVAEPVTIDQAISLLMESGQHARNITRDLEEMTQMIRKGEGLLGSLVADESLSNNVASIINQLNSTSRNFSRMTVDFSEMASAIRNGEGTLGILLNDNTLAERLNGLMDSLYVAGHHAVATTRSLSAFSHKLNSEEGLLGQLASDTALTEEVMELLQNFNEAAKEINNTAERINNSWLLNLFGRRSNGGNDNE